jgi:hypothetical protein
VTVIAAVAAVTLALAQPPGPSSPGFGPVEVELTDGGVLKLRLLDDKLDFVTPYGVLAVPVREVRRIDVADRLPPAQEKAIADAVADLLGDDARRREAAKAELIRHGAKAVPPVRRARKQAGPDAVPHVADLLDRLLRDPATQADVRDHDLLVTDDSQIAGRLTAAALRVYTTQFGELSLRVADVRVIRSAAAADADLLPGEARPGPTNMTEYRGQFGQVLAFRVTGSTDGSVWGSGPYTMDSTLAAAAVHAGVLRAGQVGVVRVKVVASPQGFAGSARNGVSSASYGPYAGGAFQILVGR